jgi:hypothetical protein
MKYPPHELTEGGRGSAQRENRKVGTASACHLLVGERKFMWEILYHVLQVYRQRPRKRRKRNTPGLIQGKKALLRLFVHRLDVYIYNTEVTEKKKQNCSDKSPHMGT